MKTSMRLSSSTSLALPSACPRLRLPLLFITVAMLLLLLATPSMIFAGSATWKSNPENAEWWNSRNWTPETVPNGGSETATFATSNITSISISFGGDILDGVTFNSGASAYQITLTSNSSSGPGRLDFFGAGIINNSGVLQNFVNAPGVFYSPQILFWNSATAGSRTIFTNKSPTSNRPDTGVIQFLNDATAGDATFTNKGSEINDAPGGEIVFATMSSASNGTFTNNGGRAGGNFAGGLILLVESSTAGDGTFINNGGEVSGAVGGFIQLSGHASAGNGTFINNGGAVSGAGGGETMFLPGAKGGNATLIGNGSLAEGLGGKILMQAPFNGGMSRVEVFGNGNLDIGLNFDPPDVVKVGSIEGDGHVFLGANNLTVGSNELDTLFSGLISDRGGSHHGTGGSFTKVGTAKLVFSNRNTYTGGTTIKRGKLIVNNAAGSGTGTGPVQVERGILGGKGIIAGAVSIGTASGLGAALSPGYVHGTGRAGGLTIRSPLTFNSDGIYQAEVNSSESAADEVAALGVTINSGAQFAFSDIGNGTLPIGTTFTIINNTSATPIAGTFSNLADGLTFTSNGNTYRVNYQGGDGNDLTLRIVP